MKKRILSFVLLISILSSVFTGFQATVSAAKAEEPVVIEELYCYYADNKVVAEVDFKTIKESGVVYLAVYDGARMLVAKQETFTTEKLEKTIEIPDIYENYIGYQAKVFCFGGENSIKPIAVPASVEIAEYEAEIIRRLRAVSREITPCIDRNAENSVYSQFTSQERALLKTIKPCIDDAVENHADELTPDFIKNYYETEISEVHAIYDEMVDQGKDDAFIANLARYFTTRNLIWLAETLGIDVEKFGIDKSKYL